MSEHDLKELLNMAREALLESKYGESLKLYLEVLKVDENNLTALNTLGFIYYFKGEFAEGIKYCLRAVEKYPENAYARKGLGLYLAKEGRRDEAAASIKKAIELDPDFVDAYHDLAYVYYESGDFESAREWIGKGVGKSHDVRYKGLFDKFIRKLDSLSI